MCGRFSFNIPKEEVEQQFDVVLNQNLRESYNIAPTQHAYVITNENIQKLQYITWGLIPYWSNDGKNTGRLINARKEGIGGKPSFRIPIRKRRCIVLADSFYEWRRQGVEKIPYRISLKSGEALAMAGVWDVWFKNDYAIKSFSIITTPANKEMESVHNRMPVLFTEKELRTKWLSDIDLATTQAMLRTAEDDILNIYRISQKLNSPKNNMAELHQEVAEPPTLFD